MARRPILIPFHPTDAEPVSVPYPYRPMLNVC